MSLRPRSIKPGACMAGCKTEVIPTAGQGRMRIAYALPFWLLGL